MIRKREVSVGGHLFSDVVINVDFIFLSWLCCETGVAGSRRVLSYSTGSMDTLRRRTYIFIARKIVTNLVVILFEVPKS